MQKQMRHSNNPLLSLVLPMTISMIAFGYSTNVQGICPATSRDAIDTASISGSDYGEIEEDAIKDITLSTHSDSLRTYETTGARVINQKVGSIYITNGKKFLKMHKI